MKKLAFVLVTTLCAFGCGDDEANPDARVQITFDAPGGTPDAAGPDGAAAPSCMEYCTTISANCTAANMQYPAFSNIDCMTYCATAAGWPAGMTGDMSGNTIGCRTYHAEAASGDPGLHCPHAGPSGGNVCGTWCEVYCHLAQKNCTGANELYADTATCMTACNNIDDSGSPGDTNGDTVQCRISHLGMAESMPAVHCPHGAETPTAPCS